jgi:hypothetical protein
MCTWNRATLIRHLIPFPSWFCSIAVARRRETPMPYLFFSSQCRSTVMNGVNFSAASSSWARWIRS